MNGWKNAATWEVWTIINNTEWMYLMASKLSAKNEEEKGSISSLACMIRDSYGPVDGVDWVEIAEAFTDHRA